MNAFISTVTYLAIYFHFNYQNACFIFSLMINIFVVIKMSSINKLIWFD